MKHEDVFISEKFCCLRCGNRGNFSIENKGTPIYSYLKHHSPPVPYGIKPSARDIVGYELEPITFRCNNCKKEMTVGTKRFNFIQEE